MAKKTRDVINECSLKCFLPDGLVGQFSSSDPSRQSSSESQRHVFKTHRLLLHWNSLGSQPPQPDPLSESIPVKIDFI